MPPYRRRLRLIRPRLQLRLIGVFGAVAVLALLLQYLFFAAALQRVALVLPHDGLLLHSELSSLLAQILLVSLAVLLPVTFLVGLLVTHRVAGPLYRFDVFLRQIVQGERPADCRLRKGDELVELCQLLNEATRPVREGGTPEAPLALDTRPIPPAAARPEALGRAA